MSTLTVATVKSNSSSPPAFQNTSGTEIGRLCRAFVNFDGTGTVAIRAQYNVSSITDNGTGSYSVNFATAMSDASYCGVSSSGYPGVADTVTTLVAAAPTTSAFSFLTRTLGGSSYDAQYVMVAIFR